jgi:hypothetical protein
MKLPISIKLNCSPRTACNRFNMNQLKPQISTSPTAFGIWFGDQVLYSAILAGVPLDSTAESFRVLRVVEP